MRLAAGWATICSTRLSRTERALASLPSLLTKRLVAISSVVVTAASTVATKQSFLSSKSS